MEIVLSWVIPALKNIATGFASTRSASTSEAGSGHPTSCCSAADIVAALFFAEMRFDPKDPQHPGSDRFVLSKGHAAPMLYAAWAEAGAFDRSRAAEAARASTRISKATRRRGCRSSTSRPDRSARASAPRSASR